MHFLSINENLPFLCIGANVAISLDGSTTVSGPKKPTSKGQAVTMDMELRLHDMGEIRWHLAALFGGRNKLFADCGSGRM